MTQESALVSSSWHQKAAIVTSGSFVQRPLNNLFGCEGLRLNTQELTVTRRVLCQDVSAANFMSKMWTQRILRQDMSAAGKRNVSLKSEKTE